MPCTENGRIATLENQIAMVGKTLERLDGKLDQILLEVAKVQVLEERHSNSSQALERAFRAINDTATHVKSVDCELQANLNKLRGMKYLAWVLWTILGGVVTALVVDRLFG